jgi:hypothetical protein
MFPEQHKAFAYSVNTDSEIANYGRLDRLFIENLGIEHAPTPRSGQASADIADWYGRYVLSPNRFQMFAYLDTVFGAIGIEAKDGSLAMTSPQRATRILRPVGDQLFSANDRTTVSHVLYRGAGGEFLISDGFQTWRKSRSLYLPLHWISLSLGLTGMLWVLAAGSVSLIRHRRSLLRRPEAPAYVACLLLVVPIPFFATQSFMALGDKTAASILLAIVTLLLPIGMLLSVLLAMRKGNRSRIDRLHAAAALCVLQWCAVLASNDLLPLRLWM